jgi:phage terminase large subunit
MQAVSLETAFVRLPYTLLPWQKAVKRDPHRFKVIVAGGRSGKTTLAVDWLSTEAPRDDMSLGDSMSFYVAPTYTQAEDIAWGKLKENIRPLQDRGAVKRIYEGDMSIELTGGQWIQLKGGDKPDSLRGVKLRRVVLDEMAFMKREVWEEVLQPRTSDYRAPVMFIGTPKGFNYFHDLAQMEMKQDEKTKAFLHPDWKTFYIKTTDAGTISQDEIDRARRDMDPRVFRQEYEASFETFGGRVYTDFDRSKHVAPAPIAFNPAMEYVIGMDFGWSAPTFAVLMNIDAQENVYIFAEVSRRETPIPQIAKLIKEAVPGNAMPTLIGCDPAGAAKSEAMGLDAVSELRSIFGFNTVRYRSNYPGVIQDGINQIRKWLRNGKVKISPTCTQTIQAFEMYRYPDPKDNVQSELPLKDGISDHPADAVRYLWGVRFPLRKSSVGAL